MDSGRSNRRYSRHRVSFDILTSFEDSLSYSLSSREPFLVVECIASSLIFMHMTCLLENGNSSEISEIRGELESLRDRFSSMSDRMDRLNEAVTYLITKNSDPEDEFIKRFLHLERFCDRKRKEHDTSVSDKRPKKTKTESQTVKHSTIPSAHLNVKPAVSVEIRASVKQPKEAPCLKKMEILSEAASWLLEPQ